VSAAPVQPANSAPDPESPEREALDRVLRSEVFNRAPNLVLFLRYVCEMQLLGRPDAIKEYNIAVEALGRGSDFDQKRDSIVRVEAHRLRKRLGEYYQTVGADEPIRILLPPGSYVPVFLHRKEAAVETGDPHLPERSETSPADAKPRSGWLIAAVLMVGAMLAVVGVWWAQRATPAAVAPAVRAKAASPLAASRPEPAVRIAAGSSRDSFADAAGGVWHKDRFFAGGDVVTATARSIRRSTDDPLYLTRREGDFEYRIPVPAGTYELRLHFAEAVFGEENVAGGGESSRVFQVQVNGGEPWTADIIAEAAGANTANIRVFREVQPAADGLIHIAFRPIRKEAAFVNAIEVLPAPGGRTLPVRLVMRPSSVVLPSGEEWSADQYSLGGSTVERHERISGPEPSILYEAERYGNFSYALPVAPGSRYTLTLRFAETWFGPGRPGTGGEGSRVFDVYCNGRTLLRNFDVFREAGGPMRQLRKVFRNLEPNAQGKLNLQFAPIRNYAMVNAIEVVDEGR
jgi:hypothetical protein